jgi:hypothetical protein
MLVPAVAEMFLPLTEGGMGRFILLLLITAFSKTLNFLFNLVKIFYIYF